MTEAKPSPTPAGSSPKRSKRICIYWGIALTLLASLGLLLILAFGQRQGNEVGVRGRDPGPQHDTEAVKPAPPERPDVAITPRTHDAWEALEEVERRGGVRVAAFGGRPTLLVPAGLRFEAVKGRRLVAMVADHHGLEVTWLREGRLAVLGRGAPEAAVKRALAGLKSSEPAARREAAWLAAWLEDVRVVEPLLAACADTDAKTARQAMRSARWLGLDPVAAVGGEKAVALLRKLNDNPDVPWRQVLDVRAQAAGALGWAGGKKAVMALEKLVREKLFVGPDAVDALGRAGGEKAVALLEKLAGDADADVRASAVLALDWIDGERALTLLEKLAGDADWNVRASAADALGRVGGEKALALLGKLAGDTDWNVRRSAAEALGRVGGERVLTLLEKLARDADRNVRWSAAEALGRVGGRKAVTLLEKLAEDTNKVVRSSAIEALGRASGGEVLACLKKLAEDADWNVRAPTADALGEIGSGRAVTLLGKLAEDTNRNVRWSAARALGWTGDKKAVVPLEGLAGDADASVRGIAAHALGLVGGEKALTLLNKLAGDANANVRASAADALGRVSGKRVRDVLLRRLTEEKERGILIVIADCLRARCPGDPAVQKALKDLKLPDGGCRLPDRPDADRQPEKQ